MHPVTDTSQARDPDPSQRIRTHLVSGLLDIRIQPVDERDLVEPMTSAHEAHGDGPGLNTELSRNLTMGPAGEHPAQKLTVGRRQLCPRLRRHEPLAASHRVVPSNAERESMGLMRCPFDQSPTPHLATHMVAHQIASDRAEPADRPVALGHVRQAPPSYDVGV